ncbi:FecR family protein [Maribacter sp. 2304DJ31-5]|uniref:FecR family protein n=1 Tax=Maribacter sp. 2304DJ31-5 TaxID=3386273 RepID=UPI0039BD5389
MDEKETKRIEKIIVKFLNKEITAEELTILDFWLRNEHNAPFFNEFVKTHYITMVSMDKFDLEKAKLSVKEKRRDNRRKTLVRKISLYAAAAVAIILITLPMVPKELRTDPQIPAVILQQTIIPGTDKAILTLENGHQVVLGKGKKHNLAHRISTGEILIYEAAEEHSNKVEYNYLTIPRGGEYFVQLSDGTKVWLNSESQLKYPVAFVDDQPREVELLYGEAYFEVSSASEHGGAEFKVITQNQTVQVLGTQFNIRAYREEPQINTTLIEGSVLVNAPTRSTLLQPGEQLRFNIETSGMEVSEVDVYSEISWKDGIFSFKGKPLKQIMKTLSRWYDVDVVFTNKELEQVRFKGVLRKNQNINEILSVIKSNAINNYEINDKTIIIK